jgi:hypothetical protein
MQAGRGIGERGAGECLRIMCLGLIVMSLLMPRAAPAIVGHYVAGLPNAHDFFIPLAEGLYLAH